MNMNANPTVDDLRALIRDGDDRAGSHVLWVSRSGDVHLSRRLKRGGGFVTDGNPDVQLRYELFEAGYEYVGPDAAADDEWMSCLFADMVAEWAKAKGRPDTVDAPLPEFEPTATED